MKVMAYIGLGANLNDPGGQVEYAFTELDRLPDTRLVARSSLYATAPVGYVDQPDFINAVAQLETALAPRALLAALLDIEQRHGRERSFRNAPRTLDLDLLLYGAAHFHEDHLTLPHPRMTERAFVLLPLTEITPELTIPGRGRAADWLASCAEQSVVVDASASVQPRPPLYGESVVVDASASVQPRPPLYGESVVVDALASVQPRPPLYGESVVAIHPTKHAIAGL